MSVGERIRKVREIRGLNQKEVAARMRLTAQTYGYLEEEENPKYGTIKKFCEAADVSLSFLLADDVPVTEETILFFDRLKPKPFLITYEQLRQRADVYRDLLGLNAEDSAR